MNKIDLIIDALEMSANKIENAYVAIHIDEALAAARELKALQPVAWMYINEDDECEQIEFGQPHEDDMSFTTPLYELDGVTK